MAQSTSSLMRGGPRDLQAVAGIGATRFCDSGRFQKLSPLMLIGDHPYHRVNLGA
jgi:hypothetical protein